MKPIEERLTSIFSKYIRLRDTDEYGYGNCFVTGEPVTYHSGECGHCIKRGHHLFKWDERNAHIQAINSNRFQNSNFMDELYRVKMIEKYGL